MEIVNYLSILSKTGEKTKEEFFSMTGEQILSEEIIFNVSVCVKKDEISIIKSFRVDVITEFFVFELLQNSSSERNIVVSEVDISQNGFEYFEKIGVSQESIVKHHYTRECDGLVAFRIAGSLHFLNMLEKGIQEYIKRLKDKNFSPEKFLFFSIPDKKTISFSSSSDGELSATMTSIQFSNTKQLISVLNKIEKENMKVVHEMREIFSHYCHSLYGDKRLL